jgi:signal transduction histidine kinase/ActR/RegA family two-component response regulator
VTIGTAATTKRRVAGKRGRGLPRWHAIDKLLERLQAWSAASLRLRHLLFIALVSVSAIPVLVFAGWVERSLLDSEMDAARDKHLVIAGNLAHALTRYARDVTAVFTFVVRQRSTIGDGDGMPELLDSLDFRYICIFDERGKTVHLWQAPGIPRAVLPTPTLKGYLRARAFENPGKPVMTDFGLHGDMPLMFLVQSLDEHSFAAAGIGTRYFSELRKAVTFGLHGHAAIVDRAGHVIAHPDHQWEATLKNISALPPVAAMMRGETGVTTFYSPSVKATMITGYAAVPGTGWGVMVPQPLGEIRERVLETRLVGYAFAGAGLVLAAFISWLLARRLTAPIGAVVATAGKIAAGERGERVPPLPSRTPRELRELAASFNRMVDDLEQGARQLAEAETALRQSQKLEALGRLTGGIAHDFNNMLTVIGGNLELLETRCSGAPGLMRPVKEASGGVMRAQKLTQQLLAYSRKQALELRPLDINRIVGEIVDLARVIVGERIEIRVVTDPGLWFSVSDKSQLETALLNLVVNARDAITGAGAITIGTGNVVIGQEEADAFGNDISPGPYVVLTITDTGVGMSAEVREKAIEPFFTTKGAGKGTGLGLSMVYGFMRQSGGYLVIDSAEGEGTSIHLYFRSAPAEDEADITTDDEEDNEIIDPSLASAHGDKTILLVEDDVSVRDFAAAVLQDAGYRVIEAPHAKSGLDLLLQEDGVDVVVSDIVMPGGMSGVDLARAALAQETNPAIILTTGYSDVQTTDWPGEVTFLPKPYRPSDLLRAVEIASKPGSAARKAV